MVLQDNVYTRGLQYKTRFWLGDNWKLVSDSDQ